MLVVDSPADEAASRTVTTTGPFVDYDVEDNGFVDEDHGHGVFVASLIEQLAPKADVVLAGVNGGHLPDSARWSPMMFSDADVIAALGQAFGLSATGVERPFDVVNLSLGGAGCGGVGSRLALGRFLRDLAEVSASSTRRPARLRGRRGKRRRRRQALPGGLAGQGNHPGDCCRRRSPRAVGRGSRDPGHPTSLSPRA